MSLKMPKELLRTVSAPMQISEVVRFDAHFDKAEYP